MVIITAEDIGVRQWQDGLRLGFSALNGHFVHAITNDAFFRDLGFQCTVEPAGRV